MTTAMTIREYDAEQKALIKQTVAQGATDLELQLFIAQCQRTGLDPFSRQIHCIKRQGKMTIQTGIDGYRLVADRTGQYAGSDEPRFLGTGERLKDGRSYPEMASVTVWKLVGGQRCPFTASVRWVEYYPGDGPEGFMWRKMPFGQLGKVAEALALRKGFPMELSGVYTHEEMDQAAPATVEGEIEPAPRQPARAAQGEKLPATGAELLERLEAFDANLAAAGLCKAGALLAYIDQKARAAHLPEMTKWDADMIRETVDMAKRFKEDCRAAEGKPS